MGYGVDYTYYALRHVMHLQIRPEMYALAQSLLWEGLIRRAFGFQ